MSRVETPLTRQPVDIEPRAMTAKRRQRIIAHHHGHCAYPECAETVGLELDHTIPLALGGRDADDNLRPLCGPHHKAKTALDVKLIAKAKRLHLTHTGQKPPPTQKIRSRGFQRRWGEISHD